MIKGLGKTKQKKIFSKKIRGDNLVNIDLDLKGYRSKLCRNIIDHFLKFFNDNSLEMKNEITMTDEYAIGGKQRVDIAFPKTYPKLFVEVDGEQHIKAVDKWGGELGLEHRKTNDYLKEARLFLKDDDSVLIRFDHLYITYEEFLLKIEEYGVMPILLYGDVQSDAKLDSKYRKSKIKSKNKVRF